MSVLKAMYYVHVLNKMCSVLFCSNLLSKQIQHVNNIPNDKLMKHRLKSNTLIEERRKLVKENSCHLKQRYT